MIRKTREAAWAVVAAMVLLAMTAAPASASFHSEAAHTQWGGSQVGEDAVTFNTSTWKCKGKTYSGTTAAATGSTLNLTPAFSECLALGFIIAVYDMNGCEFQYHDTGTMSIVCPEGKSIVMTSTSCDMTIPAQTGLTGVTYANEGSGKSRDIKFNQASKGLKYTQTSKAFPGCTPGSFTNGTITAVGTITGANTTGEQVGVWVE